MRKSMLAAVLGYGVSGVAMADSGLSTALQLGYRADSLDWNIASDLTGQTTPNIISELQWTDLQIPLIGLDVDAYSAGFFLRGKFAYGEIDKGDNQDSDYFSDNRTDEFSRSNNAAGGEVADASIGLGYRFDTTIRSSRFNSYLMPMLGYSIHTQDLQMTNGFQTIPATGAFPGLNSTYDTEWQGGWLGLVFGQENSKTDLEIEFSVIYHDLDYQAEADWNLRVGSPDGFLHPKSYEHVADGSGMTISLQSSKKISKHAFWVLGLGYKRWQTGAGLTTFYIWDGSTAQQRLNKVNWESSMINVGLGLAI